MGTTPAELEEARKLKCPKCNHTVPGEDSKCPNCGHDVTKARRAVEGKLNEAELAEYAQSLDAEGGDGRAAFDAWLDEAKLSSKERSKLPKSAFAIPETESYPIHDESHARNALARVSQHGSPDEKKRVRAAVKKRYPNLSEAVEMAEGWDDLGRVLQEAPVIPDDVLYLSEAATVAPGAVVDDEGKVLVHIIRPGVGKGKGNHLYEADMLREHAHMFGKHTAADGQKKPGWKMYLNHLSPQARRQAGGLPREVQDYGGRIAESWWDEDVPAEGRFGQGAVVGKAIPSPYVRALIENDPEALEASISAQATSVHPRSMDGQKVWVVEGIRDRGSVDWVTEAGAGGRVAPILQEAAELQIEAGVHDLDDQQFVEYVREHRPEIAESLFGEPGPTHQEEHHMPEGITPDMLAEALQSDEVRSQIDTLVEARVDALASERVEALLEARLDSERDLLRAEARADSERSIQLRDLRDSAHRQIDEAGSRLPQEWRDDLKSQYTLSEAGEPTDRLDVIDEVDTEGKVTKSAATILAEAVKGDVEGKLRLYAAARPTRVRSPQTTVEEGEPGKEAQKPKVADTSYGSLLSESGMSADLVESAWQGV